MENNKALKGWYEEQRSSYIYSLMAEAEKDAVCKQLFLKLAQEALQQSQSWAMLVNNAGLALPATYRPDIRTKLVGSLIHQFGASRIKPILAAVKIRGLSIYSNTRLVGYHPIPEKLEEVGASHSGVSANGGLRAAVFGVNDGLVSIACLVMGVAGAATANSAILLTGLAGLLAGAFSMAAGEYISMRSQREMFEHQIALERAELEQYPEEEAKELALIYMARGMDPADAQKLANKLIADPKLGLDTLAREELGLNPDELGSPWLAAISSFIAFTLGGAIPLFPYLFGLAQALTLSVAFAGVALFAVGATLSLFTGRKALLGGLRMLFIGGSAGVMTYWIGHLMGATLL